MKSSLASTSSLAGQNWAVLGASGWIGSNIVKFAKSNFVSVTGFGRTQGEIRVEGQLFPIHEQQPNSLKLRHFDVIWDCAFPTRSFMNSSDPGLRESLVEGVERVVTEANYSTYVYFSSGAAVTPGLCEEHYGRTKSEIESLIQRLSAEFSDLRIARVWNISGGNLLQYKGFALSDFMHQALVDRQIVVSSPGEVWRRYSPITEVLLSILLGGKREKPMDSGGEVVELRELARLVAESFPFDVKVVADIPSGPASKYYSDSQEQEGILTLNGFSPASLREQILGITKSLTAEMSK